MINLENVMEFARKFQDRLFNGKRRESRGVVLYSLPPWKGYFVEIAALVYESELRLGVFCRKLGELEAHILRGDFRGHEIQVGYNPIVWSSVESNQIFIPIILTGNNGDRRDSQILLHKVDLRHLEEQAVKRGDETNRKKIRCVKPKSNLINIDRINGESFFVRECIQGYPNGVLIFEVFRNVGGTEPVRDFLFLDTAELGKDNLPDNLPKLMLLSEVLGVSEEVSLDDVKLYPVEFLDGSLLVLIKKSGVDDVEENSLMTLYRGKASFLGPKIMVSGHEFEIQGVDLFPREIATDFAYGQFIDVVGRIVAPTGSPTVEILITITVEEGELKFCTLNGQPISLAGLQLSDFSGAITVLDSGQSYAVLGGKILIDPDGRLVEGEVIRYWDFTEKVKVALIEDEQEHLQIAIVTEENSGVPCISRIYQLPSEFNLCDLGQIKK